MKSKKSILTSKFLIQSSLLLFLLMTSFSSKAQENVTDKAGELTFKSETIDYGKIAVNSEGGRTFAFKNTGNAPIVISKVKTSCGCTVADYPKEPVMPGATGEIAVKYDTKRIGNFTKTLTVFSNASKPQLNLRISGEILPAEQ
ncbi:DUF1573 domain-containing protein [Aegicerativicinus sediminis]|uniref:DUF1573 domain-containing protein n=1 Tax=Aegicerativicinus sediminis TaxID=2893202 RepID=UPI001E55C5D9|nr:DUF1573 domain-containing protein [Aegicerativicinus sediminis]